MTNHSPDGTTPPRDTDLKDADLTGRKLGDYQVLRHLGSGAMAEVYLAEQTSLRRKVALKVLKSALASDEIFVRRFQHEAQAAASLVHANIVQIHEVGCQQGLHYIAQEYVEGQNLRELMARHGAPDVAACVTILRQVTLALQKAAEQGVIHRDIKPENILLARDGSVKVADFGLARSTTNGELNLTQVGVTMGTPLYMSPEQVEGRPLDPRSDLYSLGVTAFHMIAGRPPFEAETALSVAVQHLHSQPARLEQLRPDVPVALARVVHRMLAKQPEQRQANAREVLAELRQIKLEGLDQQWWDQLELGEAPAAEPTGARRLEATQQLAAVMRTQTRQAKQQRRQRRWIVAAALGALLGGALSGYTLRQPSLLAGAKAEEIARQANARSQFFYAQLQPENREAWLASVRQYFPSESYYIALADQELGRLYLQQGRLDEAMQVFERLAQHSPEEPEFVAFGLAGQSVVLTMQGQHTLAAQRLASVAPLRRQLEPRMAQLLRHPLEVARRSMDQSSAQQWDEWIRTLPTYEADDAEHGDNGAADNGAASAGAAAGGG